MGPFEIPLRGISLIEASAGTGKTFTISALYLRLLLELGLAVEQILVVTYTKAATAELRDRIRRLLVTARSALEAGSSDDPICRELIAHCDDPGPAVRRLRRAILEFDRANISTIHGFCQRMLADHAFESGTPFQVEMITDQRLLVQEVVDDFWRLQIQDLPAGLVEYLLAAGFSPDSLAQVVGGRLGRDYLELRGQNFPSGMDGLESAFIEHFSLARARWQSEKDQVCGLLRDSKGLKRNLYRGDWLRAWVSLLDGYLGEDPGPWFDRFSKFCTSTLADSLVKGGVPPKHPFFEDCERLLQSRQALLQAYEQARVALLGDLFHYSGTELSRRKTDRGVQFYDDLLTNLQRALAQDSDGSLLARIRNGCQAALVDEFQDTDPLQYGIFSAIFKETRHPLFLVGDPKQAIYSFRGADIFAYLRAGRDVLDRYALDSNWRSTPALLNAINTLFNQIDNPFIYSEISYKNVVAGAQTGEQLKVPEEDPAAFRLQLLRGSLTREQALEETVQACAAEINRLITLGNRGEALIGSVNLSAGDLAVLVRTHHQGQSMKQALLDYGIHSVQHSQADVFHSQSADSLELVLRAIAYPGREALALAALATDIMGVDGGRLARISGRDIELEQVLEGVRGYHDQWREHGFMRMFRQLLLEHGVAGRLLGLEEGERRLTDLLHLGELLHQQERGGRPGIELLLNWFIARRQSADPEDDTSQLRLESDDQLVQIVTVHKSKGLQYPIVFYPFGWDSGIRDIRPYQPYEFHDPDQDYRAVLDLGSNRWEEDKAHAHMEAMAEGLRLLYVALTRAEQRCYLYCGDVKGAGRSALAWLLNEPAASGMGYSPGEVAAAFESLGEQGLTARLQRLVDAAQGSISVNPVPAPTRSDFAPRTEGETGANLRACSHDRNFQQIRRITSFSALTASQGVVEWPDHDAAVEGGQGEVDDQKATRDIFGFPRGTGPGSCLHRIFELLDFSSCERPALQQLAAEQLNAHGIDSAWSGVVSDMVQRVLATSLEPERPDFCLQRVPKDQCLVELEFYYPLEPIDGAGLSHLLQEYGEIGPGDDLRQALERLSFPRIQGFMKGFIDLVFQFDGRFYLADYKSNWLGGTLQDYRQERLRHAMAAEHYHLQYLLYSLALHRYLGTRIADYHYDRHFGGSYYLFLRGISPDAGPACGIYRSRPEKRLIEALDRHIGRPQRDLH